MKQDHNAKLKSVEASMARWQTRLTRATNALNKLSKQRRRLLANKVIADMTAPPGEPTPNQKRAIEQAKAAPLPEGKTRKGGQNPPPKDFERPAPPPPFQPAPPTDYDALEKMAAELVDTTIPPELKRDANVDAMKAERRKREEAERHKMPLTGKAAMDYVKVTPKPKRKVGGAK